METLLVMALRWWVIGDVDGVSGSGDAEVEVPMKFTIPTILTHYTDGKFVETPTSVLISLPGL